MNRDDWVSLFCIAVVLCGLPFWPLRCYEEAFKVPPTGDAT